MRLNFVNRKDQAMRQDAIRRVLIIGAGTLGQQIGWQCAAHGCEVVLYDVAAAVLDDARRRVAGYAAELMVQESSRPSGVRLRSGVSRPRLTRSAPRRRSIWSVNPCRKSQS